MSLMLTYVLLGGYLIWFVILSFFLYKTKKHYSSLTSHTNKYSLEEILEQLVENDKKRAQEFLQTKDQIATLTAGARTHFQKLGLLRYNPFNKRGGDQSFILALIDTRNSGMVLNFIYTTEGMRVYAKQIKDGKGDQFELSIEEQEAIRRANES